MECLTEGRPAPTHDLIRLRAPIKLAGDAPPPAWVEVALGQIPWVVVRRGHIRDGFVPVGVRGATRSHRFPALVAVGGIADRLSPEDLIRALRLIEQKRKDAVPALAALDRVADLLMGRGFRWGPGGSVGFELATGIATATASSDLDLILRQDDPLAPDRAADLLAALVQAAAPVRRRDARDAARRRGARESRCKAATSPRPDAVRSSPCGRCLDDGRDCFISGGVMTVAFLFPGQGTRARACSIVFHSMPR